MKKKFLLIVCVLFVGITAVQSQIIPKVLDKNNMKIKEIAQIVDNAGWVYLKKEKKLSPDDLFVKYKEAFGLSMSDEMIKIKTKTDDLGQKHYTFQQYYKGLKVENFTYLVHEKGGVAEIVNGELLENISLDETPSLSPEESFRIALGNFKSNKWAWQDKDWEAEKQADKENPTWKPKGELMIIDRVIDHKKTGVLVYRFDLLSLDPYFQYAIYINANTGAVEKKTSLSKEANGTAYTLYNGTQNLTTYYRGLPNWDFILKDDTRGYICTKNYSSTTWNLRAHIDNHENLWHNAGVEVEGATAQWSAEKTYDYYHINQYRHGVDNNNIELRINRKVGYDNASWEGAGQGIYVGYLGTYFLGSLDIMGHEYTHGVIDYEAALVYEKEPGALSESFADIFGTMVEKYAASSWDWTLGEDVFSNDYLRSMSDPHAKGDPSTYLENGYWIDVTNCTPNYPYDNDFCGVHTNSGVQNHWFYLLSQAIGTDKAARIAYYNLCYYLSAQSGYPAARNGSISAAIALYGECSNEYEEVMNAWAAVGVGTAAVPCLNATIGGPSYLNYGEVGYWDAYVTGGYGNYNYSWYMDYYLYSNNQSVSYAFHPNEIEYHTLGLSVTDGSLSDYVELYLTVYPDGMMQFSSSNPNLLSLYPNPANGITTLQILEEKKSSEFIKDEEITVSLIGKSGQVFLNTRTKSRSLEINTTGLQNGVYTIITSIGNRKSSVNLIVNH